MKNPDFLVIGAGIIGVNIALKLREEFRDAKITVIDKEKKLALHGSGRNSGVLHAGFYYTADSLKARFCRDGNRYLTRYCSERKLPLNRCGKLVVAKNSGELRGLEELFERGRRNGVEVSLISAREASELEPKVKTCEKALWSPSTSTVDPKKVLESMGRDAEQAGIEMLCGTKWIGREKDVVVTDKGGITPGYVVNTAGLYADVIAREYGFSRNLQILPFKGLYLYSSAPPGSLRTHIYPVPDLNYPFLGVHFTVTVKGVTKIGPTAIPALWRENYSGLENFRFDEFRRTLLSEAALFCKSDFDFRKLAVEEVKKNFRSYLVGQAQALLRDVRLRDFKNWGAPGIRAQLFDTEKLKLVQDFAAEGDAGSFHVLNAVSPAFTASEPFAAHCLTKIREAVGGSSAGAV